MAFFSLSVLGPQNSFAAARPETYSVALFDLAEFAEAFDAVDAKSGKSGALTLPECGRALEAVFRGPLPAAEGRRCAAALEAAAGGAPSLPRAAFLDALSALIAAAEGPPDTSKTATMTSYRVWKAAYLRGRRPEHGPEELYTKPLTLLGDYGWRAMEADYHEKRHVSPQSEITKHACALWKAGVV